MTLEAPITTLKQAVAYLRVSTDEQTCLNQKLEIEQFAKQNGFTVKAFYQDDATSGKTDPARRKGFSSMLQFVQSNPVDAIIVYSISRIGRDMLTTLETIRNTEKIAPIVPIAPSEKLLQTLDPSFRAFMLAVFGFMADLERKMISERTKAGLKRARAQGTVCTRPRIAVDTNLLLSLYKDGAKIRIIRQVLGISHELIYQRLAECGVITRRKKSKGKRVNHRPRKARELLLQIMRELGPATSRQISQRGKELYPYEKLWSQIRRGHIRTVCRKMVDLDKEGKWYIVEQKPV